MLTSGELSCNVRPKLLSQSPNIFIVKLPKNRFKMLEEGIVSFLSWSVKKDDLFCQIFEVSLNSSDSIKLIELIWKTMIDSWEWNFMLPIMFKVISSSVIQNTLVKKLHIVKKFHWCLFTIYNKKILQIILLSQSIFFPWWSVVWRLHELIFNIPCVIQISSIKPIQLRFNLGTSFNWFSIYTMSSISYDGFYMRSTYILCLQFAHLFISIYIVSG